MRMGHYSYTSISPAELARVHTEKGTGPLKPCSKRKRRGSDPSQRPCKAIIDPIK